MAPELAHYHEPVKLLDDDLSREHSKRRVEALWKALQVGKVRAYRRAPPMELLENTKFNNSYFSDKDPGKNVKHGDTTIVYWRGGVKQIHVVGHTPQLLEPQLMEPGKAYYLAIRATHATACNCVASLLNNNMPANFFILVCSHKDTTMFYGSTDEARDPMRAFEEGKPAVANPTMIYFARPSQAYTVMPLLVLRQSLAKIKRAEPRVYTPAFSTVNLDEHPELVAALQAQVAKGEVLIRTRFLEVDAKATGPSPSHPGTLERPSSEHRFPTRVEQFACKELRDRDPEQAYSVDDLLNNSVFVAPAWGTLACSFCPDGLCLKVYRGVQDMIAHLMKHHRRLWKAYFTCPACFTPEIFTAASYVKHFADQHSPILGLIVRMDETCLSSRLSWGLALLSVFQVMEHLHTALLHAPQASEPDSLATARGGFCEKTVMSPQALRDAVTRQRISLLPLRAQQRVYQAWKQSRNRPASAARSNSTASPSPSCSYAAVAATRAPAAPEYQPRVPRPNAVLDTNHRSRASTPAAPQPMEMEGPSDIVFVGQVKAEPHYTIPLAQRSQAAADAILAEAHANLARPVAERAATSALEQPHSAPLSLEPPARRTVVFHRENGAAAAAAKEDPTIEDLTRDLLNAVVQSPGASVSAPLPPARDPLGLEAEQRGEPEKHWKKDKKSKRDRHEMSRRIRDEVGEFPDTPDTREPALSLEDDEVTRATASIIQSDGASSSWADDVPTPPPVDRLQLAREQYSPSRVSTDEYGVQGYSPTHFRNNMETGE
jgi:hypothetical protein